jgi:hypothetical protein
MEKEEKKQIAIVAGAGSAIVAYYFIKSEIQIRRNKKAIETQTKSDIDAIRRAAERVQGEIKQGRYNRSGIRAIANDLKFYEIIENEY